MNVLTQFFTRPRALPVQIFKFCQNACAGFACLLAVACGHLIAAEQVPAKQPDQPILVGGTTDNYPYSYLDEGGKLTGFAVEVFDAVARQMDIKYSRVLGSASEVSSRFLSGQLTVHPFYTRSESRVVNTEYSLSFVSLQMAVFRRRGDHRISNFTNLGQDNFVIAVGGAGRDYSLAHGIPEKNLVRAGNNEAFQMLADSKADVALFTRLVGVATIELLGLRNLEASPVKIPDATRDYRFAVKPGEARLLAQLNEGLAAIKRTGEFDAIYQKWFERFEPRKFTREELTVYVVAALALALAITFWGLLRQRQLRRHLAKQTEDLTESQAILAEAQQFARVGHWRRIFSTGELIWSDETFRVYDRDPTRGTPTMDEMLSWVAPADRALWDSCARRAREDGQPYEFDCLVQPHVGVKKFLHVRGRPTRDTAGKINGLFGTVQDITQRRQAEQALMRSEQLLRAIYDTIPYAMGVVENRDACWRNVSMNPEAMKLLDLTLPPPGGVTLAEMGMSPARQAFWHVLLSRSTETGTAITQERHSEEKNRDYRVTVVPLEKLSGCDRCCFFVEDITSRKQKDAEISQGRRLRAIGELVGGIAHEFNNLLTPILLKAGLLKSEWSHEPLLAADLQVIADTARRSADLTRRLLTFGRRAEVIPSLFTLSSIIEGNFKLLRHTIDRRIELKSDLPPILPTLYLNSGDVQQVILNLLLNARDTLVERQATATAASWKPQIRIFASALDGTATTPLDRTKDRPSAWIKVTCEDNGMGMPAAVIERVFEPFYTTKPVGRGTGLGLATVWHLITEMGGRVEVSSVPGEGTAFCVFLPVVTPPSASENRSGSPFLQAPTAHPKSSQSRPLVLLAEDEEIIAEIITQVLQSIGIDVTHACNGSVAWERLAAEPGAFAAIILDLNMPGMAGLEFLRRARNLGYRRPVVVTSGRVGDDERRELHDLEANTILQKPFSVEKLLSSLTEAGITSALPPNT